MQGNLNQVPLPEVLQFVSMGKSTGLLLLSDGQNEVVLSIISGKIVNSSSLDRKRRLGELLVNRGLLKRSELSRLLKIQKTVESDKKLGQILIEREIVTEQTIKETIRLQLEEEIWNLFAWEEGDFDFRNTAPEEIGVSPVSVDIEPLILEGTRRNDEWKKILSVLPHDNLILRINDINDEFERDIKLRDVEWRVLSQINGDFTVRAVVNRSNMGRFEVFIILSQFLRSGLISVDEERTAALFNSDPVNGGSVDNIEKAKIIKEQQAAKKGLLSNFLGDKSSKGKRSAKSQTYLSPLGLVAEFVNVMYSRLASHKDYKRDESEGYFLDLAWIDIMQIYTRADLIMTSQNHIEVRQMEHYLEKCEFSEVVDECYEDAIESLMNMVRACYSHFIGIIGQKVVDKTLSELFEEFGDTPEVTFRGPFPMTENIKAVLRLN